MELLDLSRFVRRGLTLRSILAFGQRVELEAAAAVPQPGVGVDHLAHSGRRGEGRRRANRALEELLAEALSLKKNAVTVTTGRASAHKRVAIEGLTRDEIVGRLGSA